MGNKLIDQTNHVYLFIYLFCFVLFLLKGLHYIEVLRCAADLKNEAELG